MLNLKVSNTEQRGADRTFWVKASYIDRLVDQLVNLVSATARGRTSRVTYTMSTHPGHRRSTWLSLVVSHLKI